MPEFGPAIEALLGSAAEAISVTDVGTAQRILAQLEKDQIGSAILRIAELRRPPVPAGELPPGLAPATAALRDPEAEHPAVALLASCYLADDLNGFLEFWRSRPDFDFLAVATRRGEIVDRRGLVSGGHRSEKKRGDGIVQREIDLRETARALADEQKGHDAQKAVIDGLAARLAEAEQALEQRRVELLAATQTVAAAQADQRGAQKAADDAANRLRRMEQELKTVEAARNEAQARWQKAQLGLSEAEGQAVAQREKISGLEARLAETRVEREAKREGLAQARLDLAERRQKVEVLDRGLGEMEKRRLQLDELLVQRQQEIEAWTEQSAELERESAAGRARAVQLESTFSVAREQVDRIRVELVEVERAITALETEQASLRAESDSAHGDLSTQEIRLAEQRQRARFLAEEVTREFQSDVATLDWPRLLWRADDEPEGLQALDLDDDEPAAPAEAPVALAGAPAAAATEPKAKTRKPKKPKGEPTEADLAAFAATNWDEVAVEIDALRQRVSGLGAVNLVAIEEYAELKQRHDFLRAQSGDLASAKTELLRAIDEINRTSQQQFEVTFAQIRKNFEYTFQTLFGGGRAALELQQTDDVLESGIEIVAQPPGTKLKGISLLSGGQRTLTAVALLFALYLVKPSPFCLLDELDAPLDESNIGRFTDLLKKFVKDSQFIIITHNKRTVAAAGAIYGVTMEERGVSKTVSMRFNHERGEPEAQPHNLAEAVASTQLAATPA
jgi:chromosome segregation protein